MSKKITPDATGNRADFVKKIGEQTSRKLKAQRKANQTIWLGFGMFGIIGWSIVVPTLLGVALGVWIDKHYPGTRSWTLALLVAGLCLGCLNAWHWITKEQRDMHAEDDPEGDRKNGK